jgi:hypothetical protein
MFLNYYYYSFNLFKEEKEAVFKKFTTNIDNFFYNYIVFTSGLKKGFNYLNICLVIYFKLGYSFISFI